MNVTINTFYYRFLLEHGADVSAINCDQELAIDIAESENMRQLLEQHLRDIGKFKYFDVGCILCLTYFMLRH